MEIIKIGSVIKNWTDKPPYKISFIMVDTKNTYYDIMLENKEFVNKYRIMRSMDLVKIEISDVLEEIAIDNTITTSSMMGKMKMKSTEKIIDIIDNIIITDNNLYITVDKVYAREKTFQKLGL